MTQGEIDKGITVTQLLAKTVLTELAVRRGDADAADRLKDLAAQADRTGELQRIVPVLETGDRVCPHPGRADADRQVSTRSIAEFGPYRLVGWSAQFGSRMGSSCRDRPRREDVPSSTPFSAMARRGLERRPPMPSATSDGCTTEP